MPKSNTATILYINSDENTVTPSIVPAISEILDEYRKLNEQCDRVLEKMARKKQSK